MTEVYHFSPRSPDSRSIVARFPANLLPNRTRVRRPQWLHKQTPNKKNIKVPLTFTNKSKMCFCCYSVIGSFVFISREYLMRDNGLAGPRNIRQREVNYQQVLMVDIMVWLVLAIRQREINYQQVLIGDNGRAGPLNTIERSKLSTGILR